MAHTPNQDVNISTNSIGQINFWKNNNSDDYCLTPNNPDQLWNNNWFCCQNYYENNKNVIDLDKKDSCFALTGSLKSNTRNFSNKTENVISLCNLHDWVLLGSKLVRNLSKQNYKKPSIMHTGRFIDSINNKSNVWEFLDSSHSRLKKQQCRNPSPLHHLAELALG